MAQAFNTPVLLMAWCRPKALAQVINAIRPVAPSCLFVACDGPRHDHPSDLEKVNATRGLIDILVDWPCRIERLYSPTNLGCRLGPITAITWFFSQVSAGIILEDDCVPHVEFLPYCAELLKYYANDTRVWCISGDNFQCGHWRGDGSYYFSRYSFSWGWATWRRCWQHYDADILQWPTLRDSGLLITLFDDSIEAEYWSRIWQATYDKATPITWWDYQWAFTCISNSGLSIHPNRNLVSNIGCDSDATHTAGLDICVPAVDSLGPIVHPSHVIRNSEADAYSFNHHFGGSSMRRDRFILARVKRRLSSLFRKKTGLLG